MSSEAAPEVTRRAYVEVLVVKVLKVLLVEDSVKVEVLKVLLVKLKVAQLVVKLIVKLRVEQVLKVLEIALKVLSSTVRPSPKGRTEA